jgi:hypothetical protein
MLPRGTQRLHRRQEQTGQTGVGFGRALQQPLVLQRIELRKAMNRKLLTTTRLRSQRRIPEQ